MFQDLTTIWLRVSLSNLMRTGSVLAQLSSFDWLRNGGKCHGGFWQKWIWWQILRRDPIFIRYFKFRANIYNNARIMAKNVISNILAAAILDFWPMWILVVNFAAWSCLQPTYEILCKYMRKWPSYGQKCDFPYGGCRHLGFWKISILLL